MFTNLINGIDSINHAYESVTGLKPGLRLEDGKLVSKLPQVTCMWKFMLYITAYIGGVMYNSYKAGEAVGIAEAKAREARKSFLALQEEEVAFSEEKLTWIKDNLANARVESIGLSKPSWTAKSGLDFGTVKI